MKIIVGNKAYSSWSLRGWLAVKQSGLPFEEEVVRMAVPDWAERRRRPDLAASNGMIPILWDGEVAVWESLAIIDYLADKVGGDLFWPGDNAARAFARSMAAEMHAGYQALRQECPTNFRKRFATRSISEAAQANVDRILDLWRQALDRFGADDAFLFGAWSAADIMFAPVVTRFLTYALPIPDWAAAYCARVMSHSHVAEWMTASDAEPWVIDKYEPADPA